MNFVEKKLAKKRHALFFVLGGGLVLLIGFFVSIPFVYASYYEGKTFPGISIGAYDLGNKTEAQLREFLQEKNNALTEDGIAFLYEDEDGSRKSFVTLPVLYTEIEGQSISFVDIDVDNTVRELMRVGRYGTFWQKTIESAQSWYYGKRMVAQVRVEEIPFLEVLESNLSMHETPVQEPRIAFTTSTPPVAHITPDADGETLGFEVAVGTVRQQLEYLQLEPITIRRTRRQADVQAEDARFLLPELDRVVASSTLQLVYTYVDTNRSMQWDVNRDSLLSWMGFAETEDHEIVYSVDEEASAQFIAEIAEAIDVLPQEPKFAINAASDRATQFKPAKDGLKVDQEKLYFALDRYVQRATMKLSVTSTIMIPVDIEQPITKTSDVNSFGIKELLGVGESDFSHSSNMRIKNIKNASDKLNGLMVAPGEEFSLVQALEPITTANGYVAEYVILGDKIEKAVGGGLCQIGTTSFRMAMNSGMPITERRNHSLVVSYYNDPQNGNPGTDATIYGPHPDFRFVNNTGHHILFTTEVDVPNTKLYYYMWGTSDGRKGYYSPPVVDHWKDVGDQRDVKTTELEPGVTKCQRAYRGALTSFTYYVEQLDGTVEEKVFTSDYRSLPKICRTGVTQEELDAESEKVAEELENTIPQSELEKGFAKEEDSENQE